MSTPIIIRRSRIDKQGRFRIPKEMKEDFPPGEYDVREIKNEDGKMIVIQELKA